MDYYAILDVQRKAAVADIRAGYHRQTQIWRIRAASSDTSVSAEAAKRVAMIEQAFNILSNPQQRAAYDRQPLTPAMSVLPSVTSPVAMPGDSLERAEYYLEQGDYHAAAGAAREAQSNQPNSAEAWSALSRAHAGQGSFDDAIYEGRRAIELAPQDPWKYADLGFIYELSGKWNDALREYQQASAIDSSEPLFQLSVGGVLADHDQLQQALPIIERIYHADSNDETACFYYARVLILMAEAVPQDKASDGYAVTSEAEIQHMREYLGRASTVNHLDQETRQNIQGAEAYLQKMEGHTFNIPFSAWRALGNMTEGYDGSVGATFAMAIVVVLAALLPLWLIIGGIGAMSSGQAGCGFVVLLVGGVLCYVWYRSIWVPRWKVNARTRDHRLRNAI